MVLSRTEFARIRPPHVALNLLVLLGNPLLSAKASTTAAQNQMCESHQLASLDLEVFDNGQVLVPVIVNAAPFLMYFELASPFTEVSEQAAARFALQRTEIGKELDITSHRSIGHLRSTPCHYREMPSAISFSLWNSTDKSLRPYSRPTVP
jgi:hypothetical protein